jgi:isoamylase
VRRLLHLKREHPTFCRRRFFQGRPIHGEGASDIVWLRPDGAELSAEDWHKPFARTFGMFLHGEGIQSLSARGERIRDNGFILLFNAHSEPLQFKFDCLLGHVRRLWNVEVDTSLNVEPPTEPIKLDDGYTVSAHSLAVLRDPV